MSGAGIARASLLGVALWTSCHAGPSGFGVELTLTLSPTVNQSIAAQVRRIDVTVSGAESFATSYPNISPFAKAGAQDTLVYRPAAQATGQLTFTLNGSDGNGARVVAGHGTVALVLGRVVSLTIPFIEVSDPTSCGGRDCTALAGVVTTAVQCVAGQCDLTAACLPGRANCSSDVSTGCETNLTVAASCGSCTTTCDPTTPYCGLDASLGTYACVASCSAATMLCGTTCADLQTDPTHCGSCDPCLTGANGRATCHAATCGVVCDPSYHLCGGACVPTADPSMCGASCTPCPTPTHANATCDGTSCGFTCTPGFADCDGLADNGCEASLSDALHCGSCDTKCSGGTPLCAVSGASGSCVSGCTGATPTRCGNTCTDLNTDPNHCSDCAIACSSNHIFMPSCAAGVCNGLCALNFFDCNADKQTDGCETNVESTDVNNCGGCARVCSSNHVLTPSCTVGLCGGTCATGWTDCNFNKQTDGCEVDLNSDNAHCGDCSTACPTGTTCTNGACCASNDAKCSGGLGGCFVYVPGSAALGTADFCLGQFEARLASPNTPLSTAAHLPWPSVDTGVAASACKALGAGYDLPSNAQWQTVARNLEGVGQNWSGGSVGSGSMNRGHSDGKPNNVLGIMNAADPCDQTSNPLCTNGAMPLDFSQKRTHVLSTGTTIWDLAGNLQERIADKITTSVDELTFARNMTGADQALLGPSGSYGAGAVPFVSTTYPSYSLVQPGGFAVAQLDTFTSGSIWVRSGGALLVLGGSYSGAVFLEANGSIHLETMWFPPGPYDQSAQSIVYAPAGPTWSIAETSYSSCAGTCPVGTTQFSSDNSLGLGYVIGYNKGLHSLLRGGHYGSGQMAGLFGAINVTTDLPIFTGFRCVKPTN